ncbi:hypothetical protein [Streptacidiphilus cavernicola]|uniref:Uncharacterized protein n=1 Tax=Streptacidiphilus cavernicola TaxID=3342716 RepID=A0ABV6VZQ2_9ACTN
MLTENAYGDSRLSLWLRVREFAVPLSMIETATARRRAGDWAGACAAAGVDVDLRLRSVARVHGWELAARVRADLRRLAPDLLRWHMPRVAPDGLLRPGLTVALARYDVAGDGGESPVRLVARTPPAWADAGQRISLALWDGMVPGPSRYPHPHPDRRFRLDLHRHLWDAGRSDELRVRSGADRPSAEDRPVSGTEPRGHHPYAVDRWAAEAAILLRAERGPTSAAAGAVAVRLGSRDRLVLDLSAGPDGAGPPTLRISAARPGDGPPASSLPLLPDAATWVPPDLELFRAGLIGADRLHPLVASALVPDHSPSGSGRPPDGVGRPHLVECRGARHRIGLVDGVLVPLDHKPDEIRREELLVALTGTPLPCLQAIDVAHRQPDCLPGVRERLDHGDTVGALAVVENLLGPEALLRGGDLLDALEAAAARRVTYGLFRAGLIGCGPGSEPVPVPGAGAEQVRPARRTAADRKLRRRRAHPRHAM